MKGGNPFGPNQRRKFQLQQQPLCPSFTREGRHPRCLLCVFNGQVSFEIKLSYKSCNILIKLPFFLGSFPKISKPPLESRKGLQGNLLLSHILTMSGVYRGTCKTSCMGGAASSLPAIRHHTGNEDVAPPWFCKCLYKLWTSSLHCKLRYRPVGGERGFLFAFIVIIVI